MARVNEYGFTLKGSGVRVGDPRVHESRFVGMRYVRVVVMAVGSRSAALQV